MHIRKNISKIPYWMHYYIQDLWIRWELRKINDSEVDLRKQEERLQKSMLKYCRKAFPQYYKEMGLTGEEPLECYPLLSKQIIQSHPEWFCSKYERWLVVNTFSTSGSTGEPLAFRITPNHDPVHQKMMWKMMGYRKGDRIALVNGKVLPDEMVARNVFFRLLSRNQMPCGGYEMSCLYLTEETVGYYFDFLDQYRPAFIRGYSHAIFRLAQYAKKWNRKFQFLIKGIQLTAEIAFDYQIALIEEIFHAKVYMQYGHSEACVFAYTKDEDLQYRCSPLYGHVEVLDEHGEHVKIGEIGEVVVTSYSNYAMPFIRYRTGDMAEYGGTEGAVVLLNQVQGRMQEVLYTKSGEKMTTAVFITKNAYQHMLKWRIIQREYGRILFRIVKGPEYSVDDENEIREVYERNHEFETSFEYVDDIPLSRSGKTILIEQHLEDRESRL